MTLKFNEEFAINPQSAGSGGGGGSIIDWSKVGFVDTFNGGSSNIKVYEGYVTNFSASTVMAPRVTASGYTDFVDFSKPFELCVEFISPTTAGGAIFGNGRSGIYYTCPSAEFQANGTTTLWTAVSTNGSSWTNTFSFKTDEIPTALGVKYILKHIWDGTTYTVSLTYNGETVTKTATLTDAPYYKAQSSSTGSEFIFGGNAQNSSLSFKNGKIFLGNTYFKQNGTLVWGIEGN